MINKTIHVPLIELKDFSQSEIENTLLVNGCKAEINVVNWAEYPYQPTVNMRLAHTATHLFVRFSVVEKHVLGQNTEDFGNVWEDSCAEIFIDDNDGVHYYNFETNCIGTMLASRRTDRSTAVFLSEEKMKHIIRFSSLPHCQIDKKDNSDEWSLVVGIPFAAINLDGCPKQLRANFYKCGDKTETPHFLSWNAIDVPAPDFHLPEFFGTLTLD